MLMTFNWVPNAAKMPRTPAESHDVYFGFCPAKSQLYRGVVKCRKAFAGSLGWIAWPDRLQARHSTELFGRTLGRWAATG
jgi:hypothetical protein